MASSRKVTVACGSSAAWHVGVAAVCGNSGVAARSCGGGGTGG